ncbi:3-alpha-hydroxysteroid dehydrogenase [Caballeronia udeis]|uniref:3-alpha-hydroxysteroid dehydrogenase n=1 Tax=Caballeronia udeis TaxID=1232866 RepID=A0A158GL48_9BURK|nr:glucose 1-dehydrogenase [Caballeronia udeis]SAL32825.1 3-alpha-hydroxysteroid dehydrogenase [Caballeronia udeis]
MGRVNGKVVIVTGAARGMGAAHARRLVEEGAKVMLTDVLDAEGEATASSLGESARYLHHDVTKEGEWQRVIDETEEAFGPVSVLVNNAGIAAYTPIELMEESDYRRIIDVNQISVFLGMKSVISSMKRAGGGSIINMSSVSGLVGTGYAVAYTASKFAVRGMSKSAAIELAPHNIRVNSVHPGLINTPMTAQTPESEAAIGRFIAGTPVRRAGEPDEVANIVLLLASDESRFSTGAEFVVDGGVSCQ